MLEGPPDYICLNVRDVPVFIYIADMFYQNWLPEL